MDDEIPVLVRSTPCRPGRWHSLASFKDYHSDVEGRETEYLDRRDLIAVEFRCRACGESFATTLPRVALRFPTFEEEPKP